MSNKKGGYLNCQMHKTRFILFCLLIWVQPVSAREIIQFKVSKPYCVFNFLETAIGRSETSATLRQFILSHTEGDSFFSDLCSKFKDLQLDYHYKREEFPESRRQFRSVKNLLIIDLVNADSWQEFQSRSIGMLPNSEQQNLINLLKQAEPIYDTLIWIDSKAKLQHQIDALSRFTAKSSEIFTTFQYFYHSGWTNDIPFLVTLYPIPGAKGNSTATPHANSLCVGVLTDETRHIERMGVVMHEMCHVLYDEQPNDFQHQIETWFNENISPYKQFAYNFFDEGLATALGNGWAYKNISGALDTTDWYNNEYINGFAKGLYPLAEEYLETHRSIDKSFIDKAIGIFEKKFPNSIHDYGILLNNVYIYSDAETEAQRSDLFNVIGSEFQMSSAHLSCPILDEKSKEFLKTATSTQLIVITQNHQQVFSELKKVFPQLNTVPANALKTNSLLSFYTSPDGGRPIIILMLWMAAT